MNKNEIPSTAEFGQLVAYLATRGVNTSEVIGNNPNGRTRGQIADELKAWLKMRPKGV